MRVDGEDLGAHALVGHLDELFEGSLLAVVQLDFRVSAEAAEVPLPLHERIARGEVLREPDERVVDRDVAVRVVLPHHVADDPRRLAERPVVAQTELVHRVEDPALHRLEPIAYVR